MRNESSEEDDCYDFDIPLVDVHDDRFDHRLSNRLRQHFYKVFVYYTKQWRIKNDLYMFLLKRGESVVEVSQDIAWLNLKIDRLKDIMQNVVITHTHGRALSPLHVLEIDVRRLDMLNEFMNPVSFSELKEVLDLTQYCYRHLTVFCVCKEVYYL